MLSWLAWGSAMQNGAWLHQGSRGLPAAARVDSPLMLHREEAVLIDDAPLLLLGMG